jgi:hypothetical protein
MDFISGHNLQQSDLEDTLDKANLLLYPYRGKIALIEIVKNILAGVLLMVFMIISIVVGYAVSNWLYTLLIIAIYILLCFITVYFVKYAYNKPLRQSSFLLSIFCRAENNRHYLNLGLELRPGFLGKWIELRVVDTEEHPDVISYFKSRFMKPANELRTKMAE